MSWFRNPVLLYVAVTVAVLGVVAAVTGHLVGMAAQQEAMDDARRTTDLLAHSVVDPAMTDPSLVDMNQAAIDDFDGNAGKHIVFHRGPVVAMRIWRSDGMVIYSSDSTLIRKRFTLDADQQRVLDNGGSQVDVTQDDEGLSSGLDPHDSGLVEVYTRVTSAQGYPLLLELYFPGSEIDARRAQILASFRPITFAGFGTLALVALLLLWGLTRRLGRLAQEREELLVAAVDASDAERRRLARDLHAGVLRELRGTSTSLQELAGDETTAPPTSTRLLTLDDGLRGTIRSLRSQLLRIYPPAVDAPRLENALADLVAPAAASGIDTDVRVTGAEEAPQAQVTLVWRAAQEAVRNAVEHARCRRIEVEVTGDERHLALRVADDGVGFVPGARTGEGTLGLRALRDLVHEAGGSLDVESGPGRGTTVRMRVGSGS